MKRSIECLPITVLLLALAGCGSGTTTATTGAGSDNPDDPVSTAAATTSGPLPSPLPEPPPPTPLPPPGEPEEGGTTVAQASSGEPGTLVDIHGTLVLRADTALVCDGQTETYPPGCGGPSLVLHGFRIDGRPGLTTNGQVTWGPVRVRGSLRDDGSVDVMR